MQPDLATWLARKPAGPKPKKPLPRVTKKRRYANALYTEKRNLFLEKHPMCECAVELFGKQRVANQIHHREGRIGSKFLDESTWMAVCKASHQWIHEHPREARAKGWLK